MLIRLLCLAAVAGAPAFNAAHAEAAAAGPAAERTCPPPPALAAPAGFEDPRGSFAPNSRAFRSIEKRFSAAYRMACRKGALSPPLVRPDASDPGRLFLKNAPSANIVSIYQEGGEGTAGPMVIEYPFIGDDGRANLPSIEGLRWAIVCSNYYADPSMGDVLECLVD